MKNPIHISVNSNSSIMEQFVRSVIVGGIASVIDISIFSILANMFEINHIIANTLSFLIGLIVNYIMSREWVFNKQNSNTKKSFLLFSIIGCTGLILSNILLYILIDLKILYYFFPFSNGIIKPSAKVLVIVLIFIWNFAARKKFVFTAT